MAENYNKDKPARRPTSQPGNQGDGGGPDQQPGKPDGKGPQPQPPTKLSRSPLSLIILVFLLILVFVVLNTSKGGGKAMETWRDFLAYVGDASKDPPVPSKLDESKPIIIEDGRIVAHVREGEVGFPEGGTIYFEIDASPDAREQYRAELWTLTNKNVKDKTGGGFWVQLLLSFGPFVLVILLIWFLIARSMRSAGAGPGGMLGSFGKSRHRIHSKDHVNVTFNDVAGVDEAKEELTEIVEFLKNPKKFQRLGGRIPRGVLLVGPPGCGKTLLAKAIAGEADVPFFSISGSDFVEMFVGVGASRVRDLFKQAKENSPCIIFLDEIDAVGRKRGGGFSSGGHDEREQTLNAILVEMDGFDASDQIIVIAATNRSDVLDPALTRPGRFDRQVTVNLPDMAGRMAILKVHAQKIKMGPDVDLERLARGTPMFSGADLAAVINEAAILATMTEKEFVEMEDLEEARDKVRFGRANKSRKIEEQERIATAYHEAGHAIVQAVVPDYDPIHKVTIIPRGISLGATMSLPEKDRYGYAKRYLLAMMRVLCGGRIAEERKTSDISSGAGMDIKMATNAARHMVLEWGMSDKLGFVHYGAEDSQNMFIPERGYSESTAKVIDEEIKRLTDEAYRDAERIITENWEKVVAVADALLRYETLSADDVMRLMRGERMARPTVAELLHAEAMKPPRKAAPGKPYEDEETGETGLIPSPA